MRDDVLDEVDKLLKEVESLRSSTKENTPANRPSAGGFDNDRTRVDYRLPDVPLQARDANEGQETVPPAAPNAQDLADRTRIDYRLPDEPRHESPASSPLVRDVDEAQAVVSPAVVSDVQPVESDSFGQTMPHLDVTIEEPEAAAALVDKRLVDMISGDADDASANDTRSLSEIPFCDDAVEYQTADDHHARPPVSFLKPGTLVGAYEIERVIGKGGMAEVYLARHTALGKQVGLKRLSPHYAKEPRLVERFFAEARRASQIRHPNVIEINDLVSTGENHFLVMEYLQGTSLEERLKRDYALPLPSVLSIGKQLCDAMHAVHAARIVHRDLKPSNVFLATSSKDGEQVKLLDFGIAKLTATPTQGGAFQTSTGVMLGTPGYMAPEQIAGEKVDHRADIYCIGLILFEMITGERPFAADSMSQLLYQHATSQPTPPDRLTPKKSPRRLTDLVMRCLEKSPDKRPQSVEEIRAELLACEEKIEGEAQHAERARHGFSWILWLLGLMLLALAVATAAYMKQKPTAAPTIKEKTAPAVGKKAPAKTPRAAARSVESPTKEAASETKSDAKQDAKADAKSDTKPDEADSAPVREGDPAKSAKPVRKPKPRKPAPSPGSFFDRF